MGYQGTFQEPNKHAGFVGFFQNLLGGILEQQQRKRRTADLMDIGNWAQGGFEGEAPKPRTEFGQEFTAKLMDPLRQAQTKYYEKGRGRKPTRDEIRYWLDKGYTRKQAVENSRLSAEISAGLKPRKSTRAHFDNMNDPEKMKFLTTLKRSAEGPYFGVEGGNPEPLNPPVADWANKELKKLPMFKEAQTTQLEEKRFRAPVPELDLFWLGLNEKQRETISQAFEEAKEAGVSEEDFVKKVVEIYGQ